MVVNFYMDKDARKTKRFQWMLLGLVISALFIGIFLLDSHLDQNSILVGFNIREHYGKPFPYLLDPFTYVGLKGGSPIVELTPPDPNYTYSFEEVLVTRFIDYYIWEQSGSKEIDNTFKPSKLNLTINGLVGHLRNRINYRVDHGELGINSIMRNGENSGFSYDESVSQCLGAAASKSAQLRNTAVSTPTIKLFIFRTLYSYKWTKKYFKIYLLLMLQISTVFWGFPPCYFEVFDFPNE